MINTFYLQIFQPNFAKFFKCQFWEIGDNIFWAIIGNHANYFR